MSNPNKSGLTRKKLINFLNEDLSREYQAIISYVNYSQVLKGAAYMNIADELTIHAKEELDHALQVSNHIDYLGGMPSKRCCDLTWRTSEKRSGITGAESSKRMN
jgi:bacterioferritin